MVAKGKIMRHKLLKPGTEELTYEIREIVKKATQLRSLGRKIYWENIGDPIEKNCIIPQWMKDIIRDLADDNRSYGYCHSKGVYSTRKFLADRTNGLGGAQITPEDILFFNGLGDAIASFYNLLDPTARVIGPSPAYSTHSSAEASHAGDAPLTYNLDPKNSWYPDLDDLYMKIKYNPNIVGILIINPDNPTGMVYPYESLKRFVEIAKEFSLFLICDEIYSNITYHDARAWTLAEMIDDVPGIAMKGISKEFPWPGSRCGWMEFYNRETKPEFAALCRALDDAKMIEVCSTTLPQMSIPRIMSDPRYQAHRDGLNDRIGKRSDMICHYLEDVPGITINKTYGAFYNTVVFDEGVLNQKQSLPIDNPKIQTLVNGWVDGVSPDYRFVYYLLGATGICVVPASSFCSELQGFRMTLLEENEEILAHILKTLKESILTYLDR
jgi:aspartate/methionine/tyrosine aminotransferase